MGLIAYTLKTHHACRFTSILLFKYPNLLQKYRIILNYSNLLSNFRVFPDFVVASPGNTLQISNLRYLSSPAHPWGARKAAKGVYG